MKNFLILHRKSANRLDVKEAIKTIQKEGHDLRVLVPWNKAEKSHMVKYAIDCGATRLIAGGGDGTINGVLTSLMENFNEAPTIELGVVPLGTANDFVRGCQLPAENLTECLRIACTRESKLVDVGKVNNHYFINVASGGFGAEITATTPADLKRILGGTAYTLMGLFKTMNLTPYAGSLHIGDEVHQGEMLMMAVGNNKFAGGGFEVCPLAELDDGKLDVVFLVSGQGLRPAQLARELEDPMNPNNELLFYRQLDCFELRFDKKLHCNLDGEPIHKKRLKFSVLPKCVQLVY